MRMPTGDPSSASGADPVARAPAAAPAEVSVVITTFEQARFLGEAIESVTAQTTRCAELVVVDDGSSDAPDEVVAKFPGVRLLRQANQGLLEARNTGLRAATGRYVAFLDADDRLLPDAVASNLACFEANPDCALVYGAFHDIDEQGRRIRTLELRRIGDDPFAELLPGNLIGMHATVMYRRDRLLEIGGFDPRLRACEDIDVFLRLALRNRMACHPTYVAEYRKHGANMSRDPSRMLASALAMLAKQRRAVRARPEWTTAYRAARASWKQHYCRKEALELRRRVAEHRLSARCLGAPARMFRIAPLTMLREGWRALVQGE